MEAYSRDSSHWATRTVWLTFSRTKIERRPLLLVDAEAEGGTKASLILQNAETIRLVAPGGNAISVVNLAAGDKILGCVLEGGRHFGMAVKETIREK